MGFLGSLILGPGRKELAREGLRRPLKYLNFAKFQLTRRWSLLLYVSRETAGPVPSAELVFFSGSTSQFSAVDDCLELGFAVYAKDDL